jgi:hypothetical protein
METLLMFTLVWRHRQTSATLAAALLLATGLTACGGGGGGGGDDAGSTAAGSSGASATSKASKDPQFRWELRFTSCLRAQGIQIADPDPVTGAADVVHDAAYQRASKDCGAKIGQPPTVTKNQGHEKQLLDATLKLARCLREHGLDVPDPAPNQALVMPEGASQAVVDKCLPASR